jgi:hypothetical protein
MTNRQFAASAAGMVAFLSLAATALAADVTGKWVGHITDPAGITHEGFTLELKSNGGKLTGTVTGGPPNGEKQRISDGKLEGDQLSFVVKTQGPTGEAINLPYSGKVDGNRIVGTIGAMMGPAGKIGPVPWEVTKK